MTASDIIAYFATDPLRILYVLGGAGGISFWLEKWLNRTRLKVRLLSYSIQGSDRSPTVKMLVEAENYGIRPTSLQAFVPALGYSKRRRAARLSFEVVDPDRQLQPHHPKRVTIVGTVPAEYIFWMFKRFRIDLTRGRGRTVYLRSSGAKSLSMWRYYGELFLYRIFGALPFVSLGLQEIDDA